MKWSKLRMTCIAGLAAVSIGVGSPSFATGLVATTPHIVVYSQAPEAETRALAERLEMFDVALHRFTGVRAVSETGPKLAVFLLPTAAALRSTGNLPPGTLGYYAAREHGAFLATTTERGADANGLTAQMILFHEYSHHFMARYMPSAYPGWYVEGFAELLSTADIQADGSVLIGKPDTSRLPQIAHDGLYPLDRLFALNGENVPSDKLSHYYGTAWLLTHYLRISGERLGELDVYLAAIASGTPSVAAANKAFIGGIAGLASDLDRYSRGRIDAVRIASTAPAVSAAVSPMSAARDALLLEEVAWMRVPRGSELSAFTSAVPPIAHHFAGDPYALAMLAEAEWRAGHLDDAEAHARAAAIADPKLVRAWLCQAEIAMDRADALPAGAMRQAQWDKAKAAIVAANHIDPERPEPLAANYRLYKRQKLQPPDLAYYGLVRAHELVPQNVALTLELAWAMQDRGSKAEALALVAPLRHDPHDPSARHLADQF